MIPTALVDSYQDPALRPVPDPEDGLGGVGGMSPVGSICILYMCRLTEKRASAMAVLASGERAALYVVSVPGESGEYASTEERTLYPADPRPRNPRDSGASVWCYRLLGSNAARASPVPTTTPRFPQTSDAVCRDLPQYRPRNPEALTTECVQLKISPHISGLW
jgi:hypothetical protein